MSKKEHPPEREDDKVAEKDVESKPRTSTDKFKALARGLLNVSRDQLRHEQEKYAAKKRKDR